MTINELLREKKISKYRLSRLSGVPYTTINDICTGNEYATNDEAG